MDNADGIVLCCHAKQREHASGNIAKVPVLV